MILGVWGVGEQVQQIQCGYDHCVAFVAEDGGLGAPPVEKIFTWGRGEEGQLGHEDKYSRCVPAAPRLALVAPCPRRAF